MLSPKDLPFLPPACMSNSILQIDNQIFMLHANSKDVLFLLIAEMRSIFGRIDQGLQF